MARQTFQHLVACLYLILLGTQAHAQSAALDCDIVKNTKPVELSYHFANGTKVIIQSYRTKADDYVTWSRTETAKVTMVMKMSYVAGIPSESQETYTSPGQARSTTRKFSTEGIPKNFDRRSDLKYTMKVTSAFSDANPVEFVNTSSYAFKSEEKITVSGCVIDVIHGETENVDPKTGKATHVPQRFFPELKLSAPDSQDVVIDAFKTTFEPISPTP